MSVAKTLDQKISGYLSQLNTKQKEAVLTVVKTFAEDETSIWKDKTFIKELDRRASQYETGLARTYTLGQMEANARRFHNKRGVKRK